MTALGKPLAQCPDNDNHNVDAIDSLMILPPISIAYRNAPQQERYDAIKRAIQSTRRITDFKYAYVYSDMLVGILVEGKSLLEVATIAAAKLR